ncbi:hypothetical protein [Streptomyces sp. ISL-11]|uniref:hypothetical protein n=1 Tax=Streptomyces sp. ISL-11 TaxID=2819174 RepID=UPI001BE98593|nr:hypothetical protein [Streptomyces sp. ISL-11]MBT2385548.1 hypothetical protein [Streptomyces sp. ISL-11]
MNGFIRKSGKALLAISAASVLALTGMGTAQAQPSGSTTRSADVSAADAVKAELAKRGPSAAAARIVCYRAHVAGIGWQAAVCDGRTAGTTGQSRAIEALEVATGNVGALCLDAHLAGIGWQGVRCGNDYENVVVGTTGQSRRMEALRMSVSSGSVSARAHIQNIGWQGTVRGNPVTVGTTGRSLRLEAIQIDV